MSISREDVYYARTNPQALADKINAIASASGGADDVGTIADLDTTDKSSVVEAINELVASATAIAASVGAKTGIALVTGAATGAVAIGATVASIVAVFAVTTATGAVAAKFLLEEGNDYTLGASSTITMEVDLSGQTLIVIYK